MNRIVETDTIGPYVPVNCGIGGRRRVFDGYVVPVGRAAARGFSWSNQIVSVNAASEVGE